MVGGHVDLPIGAFVNLIAEHFEKLPDKVQGLINFEKFSLISAEVSEFQQYQPIPYASLQPSGTAQRWYRPTTRHTTRAAHDTRDTVH